jgi:hypothetical protein
LRKFLAAFLAVYFSGCHIGDRLDVDIAETDQCFAPVVQFQFCGFLDKLRPLGIELTSDIYENVGGIYDSNVSLDFRLPDIQERQKIGLAISPSISLGKKVSGYSASDSARQKANDYWYYLALHGVVGFCGGIFGSLSYLAGRRF